MQRANEQGSNERQRGQTGRGRQDDRCGDQPPADLRRIFIRQLQILGSTLGDLDEFAALLSLVRRTGLRPVIDAEFPMAEAHAALDRLGAAERFGKVAITIADGLR